MEPLVLKGATDTPSVHFDPAAGIFEISGVSLPSNVLEFYNPVLEWLDSYAADPNDHTVLSLRMDYLNTSSAKVLNILFRKLEILIQAGKNAKVCWYYAPNEPEMKEMGLDYASGCHVPFEIISLEKE